MIMGKSVVFSALLIGSAFSAVGSATSHSVGSLDDSNISMWGVPAPRLLLHSKQNIAGTTNVIDKSCLSAELSCFSEGAWVVQTYEIIKREMYVQGDNGTRWIGERVLKSKKAVSRPEVVVPYDDVALHEISAFSNKEYILAQMEYIDVNSIPDECQPLDGPYVVKRVFIARNLRSGAVTLSFMQKEADKNNKIRMPTVTRFFEIAEDELRVKDDRCITNDLIYSFANIDSQGDFVMYLGCNGYSATVTCAKKDVLRYERILAERTRTSHANKCP